MQSASMLPFHFTVMTIFGVWCPAHWSPLRRYLRNVHLLLVIMAMYSIVACQIAKLAFDKLTFDEFNDTFYIILATGDACFKLFCNISNRTKVLQLIGMFQETCCLARDDFERNIKRKYDDDCRKIVTVLLVLVELSVSLIIVSPLFDGFESRKMPYEIKQLYPLTMPLVYWLSFAHHAIAGFLFGGVNIVTDATVAAFMLQLCGQIDLVAYRLSNLPSKARQFYGQYDAGMVERSFLRENIKHHLHIYKIAEMIVTTFDKIIMAQFYVSTLQICVAVYQVTTRVNNVVDLLNHGFFLMSMFATLGVYCYFGNELSVKSVILSDAIFSIDWTSLTTSSKRSLAFMIHRSSKPIEISDGVFVRLTMQTFASVVKTSYSAINVLKSTR